MRVEIYFQQMQRAIESCPVVQTFNIAFDKRSTHTGFVRGEVYLVDGSILHLREFVDVETVPDRLTYVYQYMDLEQRMIFRYDNTGHHRNLNLPTYPHHKHDRDENNVVASPAPELPTILEEIEALVQLPT